LLGALKNVYKHREIKLKNQISARLKKFEAFNSTFLMLFSSLQTSALRVQQLLTFSLAGGASLLPPHFSTGHGPHGVCARSQEQDTLLLTTALSSDMVPFSCHCGLGGGVFRSHGDLG